jgi:hypothetical protein
MGGLHHAQQELPRDDALLAHARAAQVTGLLAQALGANGGQVVEHHRQRVVDQGPQQVRHALIDLSPVVHQRVHRTQQLLVGELRRLHPGHAHRLRPAQHAELGVRVAQPIEHHQAHGLLDRGGVARPAKDTGQGVEADLAPELVERPDVAQRQSGLETHLGRSRLACQAAGLEQRLQQALDLAAVLVDASERHHVALAGLAGVVAQGFDELGVVVSLGASDLDEHDRSLPPDGQQITYMKCVRLDYTSIASECAKSLIPLGWDATGRAKKRRKCRTS